MTRQGFGGKKIDPSLLLFERLGVFADWKFPTDEELRFISEKLHFDDVIIGIPRDKKRAGWVSPYAMAKVVERIKAIRQANMEPVVMPWAKRGDREINEMCDFLLSVTEPETAILLDAEEEWYEGRTTVESAADLVADRLSERTWGVSGIGRLHWTVDPIARLAHFNVPQCYSFWRPKRGAHWSHSKATFPGPQQVQGYERWTEVNPSADLIMGLGCYWTRRPQSAVVPELDAKQIMRFSCAETLSLGVSSAWWWSLKWLLEDGARGDDVRDFFGANLKEPENS